MNLKSISFCFYICLILACSDSGRGQVTDVDSVKIIVTKRNIVCDFEMLNKLKSWQYQFVDIRKPAIPDTLLKLMNLGFVNYRDVKLYKMKLKEYEQLFELQNYYKKAVAVDRFFSDFGFDYIDKYSLDKIACENDFWYRPIDEIKTNIPSNVICDVLRFPEDIAECSLELDWIPLPCDGIGCGNCDDQGWATDLNGRRRIDYIENDDSYDRKINGLFCFYRESGNCFIILKPVKQGYLIVSGWSYK